MVKEEQSIFLEKGGKDELVILGYYQSEQIAVVAPQSAVIEARYGEGVLVAAIDDGERIADVKACGDVIILWETDSNTVIRPIAAS